MESSFAHDQDGFVDSHGEGLAQRVLGVVRAVAQSRHLAVSRLLLQLQGGLESVLAEDVGHQIGAATLGFLRLRVDLEVPGRKVRIEYLLDANQDVHVYSTD